MDEIMITLNDRQMDILKKMIRQIGKKQRGAIAVVTSFMLLCLSLDHAAITQHKNQIDYLTRKIKELESKEA